MVDIILIGSFYEGIKIGVFDEFDFMLILMKFFVVDKIFLYLGCFEWYFYIKL